MRYNGVDTPDFFVGTWPGVRIGVGYSWGRGGPVCEWFRLYVAVVMDFERQLK
jgi:hypothetical protein